MTLSSIWEKYKAFVATIGKYGSTSAVATSADFAFFHVVLTNGFTAVQSTVAGRSFGAVVAYLLHRKWVFQENNKSNGSNYGDKSSVLITRYISGVLLGMGLNVGGVWVLTDILRTNPWAARIVAACAVWFLMFLYNKNVVFKTAIK